VAYKFTVKATTIHGNSSASVASDAVTPGYWAKYATGPGGGKVFFAPGTPYYDGKFTQPGAPCGSSCRYLEIAQNPVGYLQWGGGTGQAGECSNKHIATGGTGYENTVAILAACPDATGSQSAPAARAAFNYAPIGPGGVPVTGWFLPGGVEGFQFYVAVDYDGFDGRYYCEFWGSTEDDSEYAMIINHFESNGSTPSYPTGKRVEACTMPVRAF
jgi:hypothetical protein